MSSLLERVPFVFPSLLITCSALIVVSCALLNLLCPVLLCAPPCLVFCGHPVKLFLFWFIPILVVFLYITVIFKLITAAVSCSFTFLFRNAYWSFRENSYPLNSLIKNCCRFIFFLQPDSTNLINVTFCYISQLQHADLCSPSALTSQKNSF